MMSFLHCTSALIKGSLRRVRASAMSFRYCRSERGRKKALPTFPQSWLAPNINLPLSLPAEPPWRMESMVSTSSSFLSFLISNHRVQIVGDSQDHRGGGELEILLIELSSKQEVNFFCHFPCPEPWRKSRTRTCRHRS